MKVAIILLGGFVMFIGLVVTARPGVVLTYADRHAGKRALHIFAVVIRLVLGVILVLYADRSSFPVTLKVIGWISIAAAVFLVMIGRERLARLIRRAARFAPTYGRLAGIVAFLFGAFIVYAVA